ncbi:hypothetical protein [Novosphingobium humi]|uniref:hypothetical protein n=1 Tax=Novosphingobium humi TaxID=2282397 RepID=UPI0025AF62D9|nr:hypothetical protein [Novosphingobium humi]WJS98197.1 hypothetical protein NYQ05_13840 [Novosphingobium humi]
MAAEDYVRQANEWLTSGNPNDNIQAFIDLPHLGWITLTKIEIQTDCVVCEGKAGYLEPAQIVHCAPRTLSA